MLGINDINLLQAQNEGLKKQNEELQREIRNLQIINTKLQNCNQQLNDATTKAKCYKQALDEIEEYIYNNTDFDVNDAIQNKTAGYDILQIIKKGTKR